MIDEMLGVSIMDDGVVIVIVMTTTMYICNGLPESSATNFTQAFNMHDFSSRDKVPLRYGNRRMLGWTLFADWS